MRVFLVLTLLTACVAKDDSTPPPRRLRRLSAREYTNVLHDLLPSTPLPALTFDPESPPNGYDNGPAALAVESDRAEIYRLSAERIAAVTHPSVLVGECDGDACIDAFLDGFAARAFRRPLTDTERDRLRNVIGTNDFSAALEVILQSPQFLYREELGETLTPYEVASELSFFLTGSLPDTTLITAAADGRLRTRDDRVREARRLLATTAARDNVRAFLHQWLATNRLSTLQKPGTGDMKDALDAAFDRLWRGGSLAGALDDGLLSQPGFLAVHSAIDNSGPINRGVFVLNQLLCAPPRPRPTGVPPVPETLPGEPRTTRDRFAAHSADATCQSCHRQIDGIGFAFEGYDELGNERTHENGTPIDTHGELVDVPGVSGRFHGVPELSQLLATTAPFAECFSRHVYRFAMGSTEPDDWRARDFTTQSRFDELLVSIVASESFIKRRGE